MSSKDIYRYKAENYAMFRWKYAYEALAEIFTRTGTGPGTTVADIGGGPGNLSIHFLEWAARVILIEPSEAMRQEAAVRFNSHPAGRILEGFAEATGLPEESVDLITVGQAIHYFEAEAARAEFVRILKPGGWLAVLRNYGTNEDLNAAIEDVYNEKNGCDRTIILNRPAWKAMDFYFGNDAFQKLTFPFIDTRTRGDHIKSLATATYAPHEGHPLYPRFQEAAGEVFDRFSRDGMLHTEAETELYLGQIQK